MKYEYLCGYESDFFTMPENIIAVVQLDHCVQGLTEFNQITECGKPVLAMRRIIAEPKRWMVEDKKAGRLPEVLSKFKARGYVWECVRILNNTILSVSGDSYCGFDINECKPIESPEEKAARLREEWCFNALGSASISSEMKHYEMKRLGEYVGNIYDALLSGDLPVPSAPAQAKDGE